MEAIRARAPATDAEWQEYFELRWRILRAPWNQPREEPDETEASSIQRMCCDANGRVVAAGRLHFIDRQTAQIRYMAVETGFEGKGYGNCILTSLEQAACEAGAGKIILHARKAVIAFYQQYGYCVSEKSHMLFDDIQHYLMTKRPGP